jgi:hypothetical protein
MAKSTVTPEPEVSEEEIMTEQETATISDEEIAEDENTDETPEDETPEEPAPDLNELPEGKRVLALGMQAMAEEARQNYLKVYGILDAQGDRDKLLAAARTASEDENVKTLVAQAQELQAQIDNVLAQADQILTDSGEVEVLSEEDVAAKREELDSHKSAFLDSVNYGEQHVVEGFGRLFEDLPGMRKRRAKSAGGGDYTMTTSIKPKVSEIVVNGTAVTNDKGNATFTYLSQYLKKDSGKSVPVGDLHKAWLAAANTENVEEIKDAVFFDFPVGDKSYKIKIVPKEAA